MSYILVIWTVVAIHSGHYGSENPARMDWRPIGAFSSAETCAAAALMLNKKPELFRCLPTGVKP